MSPYQSPLNNYGLYDDRGLFFIADDLFFFPDDCRQMEFKHTFDGKRLKNHVIRKATVVDAEFCEHLCFMESNCDSYNLKKSAMSDGKFMCELNNATFEGQKGKMETDPGYLYRGIEVR